MIFTTGTIHEEDLVLAFGALDPATLAMVLKDGRPTSYLLHAHLLSRYSNLRRAPEKTMLGDGVVDTDGRTFQLRVITNRGMCLLPSKNLGVGRQYSPQDYREALQRVFGFILIDVTKMPHIRYGAVEKEIIPFQIKFSYQDALALLKISENLT